MSASVPLSADIGLRLRTATRIVESSLRLSPAAWQSLAADLTAIASLCRVQSEAVQVDQPIETRG